LTALIAHALGAKKEGKGTAMVEIAGIAWYKGD